MSKMILEFDLEEPYQELDAEYAFKAKDAFLVLHSFSEYLRRTIKTGGHDARTEAFEEVMEEFHKIKTSYVGDLEIY